jgi:hypothetical protein
MTPALPLLAGGLGIGLVGLLVLILIIVLIVRLI